MFDKGNSTINKVKNISQNIGEFPHTIKSCEPTRRVHDTWSWRWNETLSNSRRAGYTCQMSSSIHVGSVKHDPTPQSLHNVCAESGSGKMTSKPRAAAAFTPFCNWETNAQISAWKRVIFAYTSNFHYRTTLSFLYPLTATGQLCYSSTMFFPFLRTATDIHNREFNNTKTHTIHFISFFACLYECKWLCSINEIMQYQCYYILIISA